MKIKVIDMRRNSRGYEGTFIAEGNKNKGVHHVGGTFLQDRKGVAITSINVKGHILGTSMRSLSIPSLMEGIMKESKSMAKRRSWE